MGWVPPSQEGGGSTLVRLAGSPSPVGLDEGTCYAAGGMPLEFTQEEFLVFSMFLKEAHASS